MYQPGVSRGWGGRRKRRKLRVGGTERERERGREGRRDRRNKGGRKGVGKEVDELREGEGEKQVALHPSLPPLPLVVEGGVEEGREER